MLQVIRIQGAAVPAALTLAYKLRYFSDFGFRLGKQMGKEFVRPENSDHPANAQEMPARLQASRCDPVVGRAAADTHQLRKLIN